MGYFAAVFSTDLEVLLTAVATGLAYFSWSTWRSLPTKDRDYDTWSIAFVIGLAVLFVGFYFFA